MNKPLLSLILSAFLLVISSGLGFAGSFESGELEKPTADVAQEATSDDNLLPICCAAAFAELMRPIEDKPAKSSPESVKITEVAKADSKKSDDGTDEEMMPDKCTSEKTTSCEKQLPCCQTGVIEDSENSGTQDS